ncbi:hypothetical protein TFKS16_2641 [Tannerella forsythia KS16]|uniref:Uncharacterized protein n=1 Tax=Tannerella forsythia (strain ATCC 43037 / JCM 10827 / CCUG 21028 A / KCTC 5666 / FDC 338) TaxID=203275 RepID=G8UP87_TANFA|nr:hypothetical protein BFO_2918 [Tannerella forsythia 92A2]BAR49994.1 hypothetical protein TF3313_2563 [Tannerella forsythia 3313]BAR52823.1 hypothetical protein TFKS16_2641 [Tannerella forsythia KS16]
MSSISWYNVFCYHPETYTFPNGCKLTNYLLVRKTRSSFIFSPVSDRLRRKEVNAKRANYMTTQKLFMSLYIN